MAKAAGRSSASATLAEASTQSSQVAPSPGSGTFACSKSVALAKPPVSVSWVMKPGSAWEPSGRIQSRVSAKLVRQLSGSAR